ncbi:MAG: biotin--[acetyl-CoA-carboxylase] ligase, partial [Acidimicrobiales bacterium]
LLADLEHRLDDLDDPDGRRRLAGEYRDRCSTLGRVVRVTLSDEILTGAAVDVTVEGHLVLDVGTCFKTITAGDVVHVHGAA